MSSSIGTGLRVSLFGESHGEVMGITVDGIAPGIALNKNRIAADLARRRPKDGLSTGRREPDAFEVTSGLFGGYTTGAPLTILIENKEQNAADYEQHKSIARPSHADYAAHVKYGGFNDYRGGGRFSGRLTAPLVAAGAVLLSVLEEKGVLVGTHILRCGSVWDAPFPQKEDELQAAIELLGKKHFPVLSEEAGKQMADYIAQVKAEQDSVGGVLQTAVTGLPAGVGEPFFDSMESTLSALLFSVPAIKGVEFGLGFGFGGAVGSAANDPFYTDGNRVKTLTNHNGGINGGITNGMPVVFQCAVKPTPSIGKPQQAVDFVANRAVEAVVMGRHDPAIVHRAAPVVTAVTAIGICDLLNQRYGCRWMTDREGLWSTD